MIKRVRGFTLIELLIVIALIAILAGAIIIALNPARQFAQARNSQRWTHINTIMNATQQNAADNNGVFTCAAGALPATATLMQASGGYDICGCLVPTFISSMPYDPSATGAGYTDCTTYTSGYTIMEDATTERVTVAAPSAELSETISITQ
ncbi:prepilin-type N-terminal cleavage/methylation domain-containing protein [Candidatus Uhrbacteria bacterium]|nr:prepilin-type N-terminal cleavage/methylation domain-containing protein [Candidatus Uhrbacteria bacterium]